MLRHFYPLRNIYFNLDACLCMEKAVPNSLVSFRINIYVCAKYE